MNKQMMWAVPIIALVSLGSYTIGTFQHAGSRAQAAQNPSSSGVSTTTPNNVQVDVGQPQSLSTWQANQPATTVNSANPASADSNLNADDAGLTADLDNLLQALGLGGAGNGPSNPHMKAKPGHGHGRHQDDNAGSSLGSDD